MRRRREVVRKPLPQPGGLDAARRVSESQSCPETPMQQLKPFPPMPGAQESVRRATKRSLVNGSVSQGVPTATGRWLRHGRALRFRTGGPGGLWPRVAFGPGGPRRPPRFPRRPTAHPVLLTLPAAVRNSQPEGPEAQVADLGVAVDLVVAEAVAVVVADSRGWWRPWRWPRSWPASAPRYAQFGNRINRGRGRQFPGQRDFTTFATSALNPRRIPFNCATITQRSVSRKAAMLSTASGLSAGGPLEIPKLFHSDKDFLVLNFKRHPLPQWLNRITNVPPLPNAAEIFPAAHHLRSAHNQPFRQQRDPHQRLDPASWPC